MKYSQANRNQRHHFKQYSVITPFSLFPEQWVGGLGKEQSKPLSFNPGSKIKSIYNVTHLMPPHSCTICSIYGALLLNALYIPGSTLCAINKTCSGQGLCETQWMPLYFIRYFSCIWHCYHWLFLNLSLPFFPWLEAFDPLINNYWPPCVSYHPKSWEYLCKEEGECSGSQWAKIPEQGRNRQLKKEVYMNYVTSSCGYLGWSGKTSLKRWLMSWYLSD